MTVATLEILETSREYVHVACTADEDPTASVVALAFTPDDLEEPPGSDFIQAAWKQERSMVKIGGVWKLCWVFRLLVSAPGGGGVVELEVGTHFCWTKIVDATQSIVKQVGWIKVGL